MNNENAAAGMVSINYEVARQDKVGHYALMVVACDPRNLIPVCNYSPNELALFAKLQNFTFHTTLVKIPRTTKQEHGVIFAPAPLDTMSGSVYGFRNESAKRFGLEACNQMSENLVTIYQLEGPRAVPSTPAQFHAKLLQELPTLEWWPFGTSFTLEDSVTTPYFDHFSNADLQAGVPWQFFNLQGQHNTLYVHASTCFESVLDCWAYANMLLADNSAARTALPSNTEAPIAIIGAGVSGLLFALKLKRLGYANIELLESTMRYGGKTHTIEKQGPYPPGSKEPTYCELGTCYMSPAYDPMLKDLKDYLVGNKQIGFGIGDSAFRGIATKGQLPARFKAPPVMANGEYVLRKAEAECGFAPGWFDDKRAQVDIFIALEKYKWIHEDVFKGASPMPSTPPQAFLNEHSSRTFIDFLRYHGLQSIVGILQYGYEVQGYGTLNTIPAFYGLVWITPPIIEAMIEDGLGYKIPIVTAWSKGWGDLWTQIVTKERLKIKFGAKIKGIRRATSVAGSTA